MRATLLPALLALALVAPAAQAGPPGDPRAAARALAEHGQALYDAGKYQDAIEVFQQADKIFHAPTLVLALARAHAGARKLVEARALYQKLVDEKVAAGAPQAFRDAQRAARDELAALEKRIPTLQIVVRGGGGRGLRVTVDEVEVTGWDAPAPVNPGAHRLAVVPLGGVGVSRNLDVAEGARERVEIELPGAAPAVVVAPAAAPPPPPSRPWLVPSLMSFGLGAVGLGVGVGAGVATLKSASDLRDRCGGETCPATAQNRDQLSSAKGMSTASTVGFVVAGVGVATGVILLVVRPGSKAVDRVGIQVGPASAGVSGVF